MAKTITDFHTEVSSWTRDELINALWAYISENDTKAWIRIQEAQDFILGADPDDPDNLTRISEILEGKVPKPAMDADGVVTHPVTGVKIYPGR